MPQDKSNIFMLDENDYKDILKQYVNKQKLKIAIEKNLIAENNDFNSLNILLSSLAGYTHGAKLSIRDTKDTAKETVRICCHFYEPVRVEWLSCVVAYKYINKNYSFNYPVPIGHYYAEQKRSGKNGKASIFQLNA